MEKFGKRQLSCAMIISAENELQLSMIYKSKNQVLKVSLGNIISEVNVWDIFVIARQMRFIPVGIIR